MRVNVVEYEPTALHTEDGDITKEGSLAQDSKMVRWQSLSTLISITSCYDSGS